MSDACVPDLLFSLCDSLWTDLKHEESNAKDIRNLKKLAFEILLKKSKRPPSCFRTINPVEELTFSKFELQIEANSHENRQYIEETFENFAEHSKDNENTLNSISQLLINLKGSNTCKDDRVR